MSASVTLEKTSFQQFTILVNGEVYRQIHTTIFGKSPKLPSYIDEKQWEEDFFLYELKRVKNYIIWRLSAKHYHSKEIERLLRDKLVSKAVTIAALTEFKEKGFFDDALWASSFVRFKQKKIALPLILQQMRLKGIGEEEIEKTRLAFCSDKKEKETVTHLLLSRYRLKNLNDFKEKQKVIQSLMRKGFSFEMIQQAIEDLIK